MSFASVTQAKGSPGRYVMLLPSVIAAGLCYWQLERKAWKEELIAQKDAQASQAPVDIFTSDSLDPYQPVFAEGTFDHTQELFVGPRSKTIGPTTRQGFVAVTPLRSADRPTRAVLVNRGWVPEAWAKGDAEVRAGGLPSGRVRVEGVAQPDEQPSSFVPPNEIAEGRFYAIKADDLAEACGLPRGTPLLQVVAQGKGHTGQASLEGDASVAAAQLPEPKDRETLLKYSVTPQGHLGYAAVWGSLSAALVVVGLKFVRGGR